MDTGTLDIQKLERLKRLRSIDCSPLQTERIEQEGWRPDFEEEAKVDTQMRQFCESREYKVRVKYSYLFAADSGLTSTTAFTCQQLYSGIVHGLVRYLSLEEVGSYLELVYSDQPDSLDLKATRDMLKQIFGKLPEEGEKLSVHHFSAEQQEYLGKTLYFCGYGNDLEEDRALCRDIAYMLCTEKSEPPTKYQKCRPLLKDHLLAFPSSHCEGNVVWNDPPGLGEDSCMKKQMVHEAINRADVVVLMSDKHLDTDTPLQEVVKDPKFGAEFFDSFREQLAPRLVNNDSRSKMLVFVINRERSNLMTYQGFLETSDGICELDRIMPLCNAMTIRQHFVNAFMRRWQDLELDKANNLAKWMIIEHHAPMLSLSMEMNYGAVKRAQQQFESEQVQKLKSFIAAPKLLALNELLRLRRFNSDILRLLHHLGEWKKHLSTEEPGNHDSHIQEGVTDEELKHICRKAKSFIDANKPTKTQEQKNFIRSLHDSTLRQGLENRIDELLHKDEWAYMDLQIMDTVQRKFDELSESFTDVTKLKRALNGRSKGADKDLDIRGGILAALKPFHAELRKRVLDGVMSVVEARCRSKLIHAISDILCGKDRVSTLSADATTSRERQWIGQRISEYWESTDIIRGTVESSIASLDDMKDQVDNLLKCRFSAAVGDNLRPRRMTVTMLVSIFKTVIRDWVKFEKVLSCLRDQINSSIESILDAVANGIPRKTRPVRDALSHFKNDRENRSIVRKILHKSKVPYQEMEAALTEMWDNLSLKDRGMYDSRAERGRRRQLYPMPVLIKDPALYEFVLGFCARISDRHGKRQFVDCMVAALAGYTQSLMRICFFVGEAIKIIS
jgi:hypothetical protein